MENVYEFKPPTEDCEPPDATTWEPVDLDPWLNGDIESPQPTIGISRTDGIKLLYPGKEHTVFGETEAGKSWLALECIAVEIRNGRDVVYIHFEEGDPASTIERLKLLYVTSQQIAEHLRFTAPARPLRGEWLTPLLDPAPTLVILDGVNEGMALHGDDTNRDFGAATFRANVVKPFTAVGAAVLSCDHVTKNGGDSRGRYAVGSGHKVNALDGAAILMENIEPFGRGLRGASRVYVTKDRPGQLRAQGQPAKGSSGKTLMGVLTVDDTGDSPDFLVLYPPKSDAGKADASTPGEDLKEVMYQTLLAQPDSTVQSGRLLQAAVRASGTQFTTTKGRDAIDDLVYTGRISEIPGKKNAIGYKAVKTP